MCPTDVAEASILRIFLDKEAPKRVRLIDHTDKYGNQPLYSSPLLFYDGEPARRPVSSIIQKYGTSLIHGISTL